MELTVVLELAVSCMIASRGNIMLKELDFAICDIAVGGTVNFVLVYMFTLVAFPTLRRRRLRSCSQTCSPHASTRC